jgi:hypothetical protein
VYDVRLVVAMSVAPPVLANDAFAFLYMLYFVAFATPLHDNDTFDPVLPFVIAVLKNVTAGGGAMIAFAAIFTPMSGDGVYGRTYVSIGGNVLLPITFSAVTPKQYNPVTLRL